MQEAFNKYAREIYSAIDRGNPERAIRSIFLASQNVGIYHQDDPSICPPLIYGEFYHLFSGVHLTLYTPRKGYYPINPERSALARIGFIPLEELGEMFVQNAPRFIGSDMSFPPQTPLSDLMILMAEHTEARIQRAENLELEKSKLKRNAEDEAYLRRLGYQPLKENPLAQSFFKRVYGEKE